MDDSTNIEIFCSYSHEDEHWRELLEKHLYLLKRLERFTLWHDRCIAPGSDWREKIDKHLETASVILLLISADFISSGYCYDIEMRRALERHKEGKARVIPILVRSVDWRDAPFEHLQMLPTDLKPIQEAPYEDAAFKNVAVGIRQAIDDLERDAQYASLPADWILPYFHNRFFLGREDLLARMRECFQSGNTNVLWLTGRKGIGKTRLVVEYIYRNWQDYQKVLWAEATDADMLVSSYIDIARFLKLPEHTIKEQALTTEAVKRWLQEHERWLLVLDNAADLPAISDLLQQPLRGHIIITRQKDPGEERGQLLKVDTLSPEQGALLLLRRAGLLAQHEPLGHVEACIQKQATRISEEFGGLPLALNQAGAYLELTPNQAEAYPETDLKLASYRKEYQKRREMLPDKGAEEAEDHPAAVMANFLLLFEKLQEKQPQAADLLRLCTFLAPAAIPRALLAHGFDDFMSGQLIEGLRTYSLIRPETQNHLVRVDRLVRTMMYDALPDEEKKRWMQQAIAAVNATFPESDWASCELWVPHALLCKEWIEQVQIVSSEAASLLSKTGNYLYEHARYSEAEPLYALCLKIREQSLDEYHLDVAQSLSNLANLYSEMGNYKAAKSLYKRCLRIRMQKLGREDMLIARTRNNLAILYKVQGKYAKSKKKYKKCLQIWKRNRKTEDRVMARLRNNLAVLYAELGNCEKAEQWFECELAPLKQQKWAAEDHAVVRSRNNLVVLRAELGNYMKAEQLVDLDLALVEQMSVHGQIAVAISLSNCAHLYAEHGRYVEAKSFYLYSLYIFKQNKRWEHSDAAYPRNGLANLYAIEGNYREAEKLYSESREIWMRILGEEHPQVAYIYHNLAVLYTKQGNYKDAKPLYECSLLVWIQKLGLKHRHTRICAHNYAILYHLREAGAEVPEIKISAASNRHDLCVLPTYRSTRL